MDKEELVYHQSVRNAMLENPRFSEFVIVLHSRMSLSEAVELLVGMASVGYAAKTPVIDTAKLIIDSALEADRQAKLEEQSINN